MALRKECDKITCSACDKCVYDDDYEDVKNDKSRYMVKQNDLTKITCCNECPKSVCTDAVCDYGSMCNWYCRTKELKRVIDLSVEKAFESGSSAVGVKVKDTVKQVDSDNNIVATTDRSCLRFIQTPQVFNKELYLFAVSSAKEGIEYTDDCMLLEACGKTVSFVEGDYENIKITTPEDVELAVNYLKKRGK